MSYVAIFCIFLFCLSLSSISSNSETSSLNTKAAEQQASLSSRISAAAMILSKTSDSLKQQELRQIALLLTNDDERVLCRSSGLIEYTCRSICAPVNAIVKSAETVSYRHEINTIYVQQLIEI